MTDRPKRPAYQWYPGDFRRDLAVQACSFEARALWREMLDLMHDGEPYGHLTAGGVPLDTAQLARLIGIPARKAAAWLRELEDRKVFSRTEAGAIYSRRQVRDEAIIEQRRSAGHEGGLAKAKQTPSETPSKPLANAKQRGKQKTPPALAVALASATARSKAKGFVADATPDLSGNGIAPDQPHPEIPAVDPPPPEKVRGGWPAQVSAAFARKGVKVDPGRAGEALKLAVDNLKLTPERIVAAVEYFLEDGVRVHGEKPGFITLDGFARNPAFWVEQILPAGQRP